MSDISPTTHIPDPSFNLNGIFIVSLFLTSLVINRVCNVAYIPIPNFQFNTSQQTIFCMIISLSLFSFVFYMTHSSLRDLEQLEKDMEKSNVKIPWLTRWKVFYWFFMIMSCLMGLLIIFQMVIVFQKLPGGKSKKGGKSK